MLGWLAAYKGQLYNTGDCSQKALQNTAGLESLSIHIIKQSPPPRLSVCLSTRDKLENYCTDFHAVFSDR